MAFATPEAPRVEVRYDGLRHDVRLPLAEVNVLPSLPRLLAEKARSAGRALARRPQPTVTIPALAGVSGVLRAGSSTLVLAAPGAGTTTFLRLLSGRLTKQHPDAVTYNGATEAQLEAAGTGLKRLAVYAPERDEHEPLLTVRETFTFAYRAAVPGAVRGAGGSALPAPPQYEALPREPVDVELESTSVAAQVPQPPAPQFKPLQQPAPGCVADAGAVTTSATAAPPPKAGKAAAGGSGASSVPRDLETMPPGWWFQPRTAYEMTAILGLEEAAGTIVGSGMIRGISGGQRKR